MPLLQFGRYRDLATAVAERLQKEPVEVIVASGGVLAAVLQELLRPTPSARR